MGRLDFAFLRVAGASANFWAGSGEKKTRASENCDMVAVKRLEPGPVKTLGPGLGKYG